MKTYLPDGDIDLTAFGGLNVEEALANDVCSVLEREDQNKAAEFVVRDAQLIRAEVLCFNHMITGDICYHNFFFFEFLDTKFRCYLEKFRYCFISISSFPAFLIGNILYLL